MNENGQYPGGRAAPLRRPQSGVRTENRRPMGERPEGERINDMRKAYPTNRPRSTPPTNGYPPQRQAPRGQHPPMPRPTGQAQNRQRHLSPEAEARRRAALEARRRAQQHERRVRIVGGVLFGAVLLILLVFCLRACAQKEALPTLNTADSESDSAVSTSDTAETADMLSEDTPFLIAPAVARPKTTAATVTLTDEIESEYGVLLSLKTNSVLARKSADTRIHPASMTKVMTLVVAYENIPDLSETVVVTSTVIDPLYRSEASLAGFAPGEEVPLRDLLYGMILPSGAEASVVLAEYVAGSEAAFAEMMNEKAKSLGLTGTHFTNCTGLHGTDHYSTPLEIAMIMAYAMQYGECAQILSTYRYTTAATEKHPQGITLESTMFSRMYGDEPDGVTVLAGKTGYTNEAHHCLVSYATDDETGEAYIFVSVNAKEKFAPIFDAIEVYSTFAE